MEENLGEMVISGRVVDGETGAGIAYADVRILETSRTAICDDEGSFRIVGGPPGGRAAIHVHRIGYRDAVERIDLPAGDPAGDPVAVVNLLISMESIPVWMSGTVVTASRRYEPWTSVSASVRTLGKDQLTQRGVSELGEALEGVAGTFLRDYGGDNSLQTVSIRGSTTEQVLILLNGRRLTSPQNNLVNLSQIPLEAVERVEVLRGGASAMYGADALGGVVNIITRNLARGTGTDLECAFGAGSWGKRRMNAAVVLRREPGFLRFSGALGGSEGDFDYRDGDGEARKRENNAYSEQDYYLGGGLGFPGGGEITLSCMYHDSDTGFPGMANQPSPSAHQWDRNLHADCSLAYPLHPGGASLAKLFASLRDQRYLDPDGFPPADSRHDDLLAGFHGEYTLVPTGNVSLTGGLGAEWDRLKSYNYDGAGDLLVESSIGRVRRLSANLSLRGEYSRALSDRYGVNIVGTGRYDEFSDFGSVLTPQFGFNVSRETGAATVSVNGNVSRSFRAPTFNELFWPEDSFARGNPDLIPERGVTVDGSLKASVFDPIPLEGECSLFRNEITDLIQWKPGGSDGKWAPYNVARVRITGIETSVCLGLPALGIDFEPAYSYLIPVNLAGDGEVHGKDLIYRPRHQAAARAGWRRGGLALLLDYRWTGRRFVTEANTKELDPCQTLDGAVNLSFTACGADLRGKLSCRNIFDASYESVRGYPMPLRSFEISIGVGKTIHGDSR